jgi:SAM-dependent methyltransferase
VLEPLIQNTSSFPAACEALFQLLINRSDMSPHLDLLDIGSGCGDSTALLSTLKPRTLKGVMLLPQQVALSRQRFPNVEFVHANAVQYVASLPPTSLDRIFALDCAYNFSSRKRFLDGAASALWQGGKIAMTDLILGDKTTFIQRLLMRIICILTSSPYSNFKTSNQYRVDLLRAGLAEISIEDMSVHVFPELEEFLHRHRGNMGQFGIEGKWAGYQVFARVLGWWSTGVVRFIVVRASKRSAKFD